MKTTIQLLFFLLISNCSYSQFSGFFPYDSILKEPAQVIFYPFVDGFQVIEVDHLGAYWHGIERADQSYPRGLSASVDVPKPVSNEYFVRDTSGTIIKAFCTDRTLEELNKVYASFPMDKHTVLIENHQFFAISNQNARIDKVHYYEGATKEGLKYGVMNRKGEQIVPMDYQQVTIKGNDIFLRTNNKWSLKNVSLGLQTEFEFDEFRFITLRDSSATEITYFKNEDTFCAFRTSDSDRIIETPRYDHMITDQYWAKPKLFVVTKDRKRGLIDFNGKLILPVEYDEIYYTIDKSCSEKPCVKLIKGDSVEFIDLRML